MAKTFVHSLALPSPQKSNGFSGTPEVLMEKVRILTQLLHHHVAVNQKARRIFYKKYVFTLSAAVPLSRKTYWVLREEHLHLAVLFCAAP